jgi:hypothetical protein
VRVVVKDIVSEKRMILGYDIHHSMTTYRDYSLDAMRHIVAAEDGVRLPTKSHPVSIVRFVLERYTHYLSNLRLTS